MKTKALIMSAMIVIIGISSSAFAQTHFDKTHPRRAEVNARLANKDHRINYDVRDGQISHTQAANLHRDDHRMRN